MAGPRRTYWKGHLRLSLVSVAVNLYTATERANRLALHQIHEPSGQRVRYEKVAAGVGPVDADDIVKGFEIGKDTYVVLRPEEIEAIRLESQKTIDLVQFVPQHEIDPRYFERPYYLLPDGDFAAEGYLVIREALRRSGRVGIGQVAMRGREQLVAIQPCGRGLLVVTLRYADDLRRSDQHFEDIPELDLNGEMIDLAEELIERKSSSFDPANFRDSYAEALSELIEQKRSGGTVSTEQAGAPRGGGAEVVDLMARLRKSVDRTRGGGSTGNGRRTSSKTKKKKKKKTGKVSKRKAG